MSKVGASVGQRSFCSETAGDAEAEAASRRPLDEVGSRRVHF